MLTPSVSSLSLSDGVKQSHHAAIKKKELLLRSAVKKKKKSIMKMRACTELTLASIILSDSFGASALPVLEYCVCTTLLMLNLRDVAL